MSKEDSFYTIYALVCEDVVAQFAKKLARPLSQKEQSAVWNVNSLMMLELVDRILETAPNVEEIELQLLSLEEKSQSSFNSALHKSKEVLAKLLSRELDEAEKQKLG